MAVAAERPMAVSVAIPIGKVAPAVAAMCPHEREAAATVVAAAVSCRATLELMQRAGEVLLASR